MAKIIEDILDGKTPDSKQESDQKKKDGENKGKEEEKKTDKKSKEEEDKYKAKVAGKDKVRKAIYQINGAKYSKH